MEELRLKFLHQKNWIHLVFGIAFLLLGFTSFFIEDSGERNWFFTQAWPIPFGLIYIWLYFYQRKNHSIIISSNSIKSEFNISTNPSLSFLQVTILFLKEKKRLPFLLKI